MSVPIAKPALPDEYLVDNRVYTDAATHRAEIARIFLRLWNYVCHESEIPAPGDFLTVTAGGQPLIVCRGEDGALNAFYNTCRHRGARLEHRAHGQCRDFTCMYHLWSYGLDGRIKSVPGADAYTTSYNPAGLDPDAFGLVPVRIDSAHRLVFVAFDEDAPALDEFLAETGDVLKLPFGLPEMRIAREGSYAFDANWKMHPENARDGYHAPLLHRRLRVASEPGPFFLLSNGHAVQYLGLNYDSGAQTRTVDQELVDDPKLVEAIMSCPFPGVDDERRAYVVTLFPDTLILVRYSALMIMRQEILGPERSCVTIYSGHLSTDSDDIRHARAKHWYFNWSEEKGNPPEDVAAWEAQQQGVQAIGPRFSILARGEPSHTGVRGDDNRIRQFWAEWRRLMGTPTNAPLSADG